MLETAKLLATNRNIIHIGKRREAQAFQHHLS
jgi:hypothetical protein